MRFIATGQNVLWRQAVRLPSFAAIAILVFAAAAAPSRAQAPTVPHDADRSEPGQNGSGQSGVSQSVNASNGETGANAPMDVATQTAMPQDPPAAADLRALSDLLSNPQLRAWLYRQAAATPVSTSAAKPAAADPAPGTLIVGPPSMMTGDTMMFDLPGRLATFRQSLDELFAAFPRVPAELARVMAPLLSGMSGPGPLGVALLVVAFVGFGLGLQRLVWWATTGLRKRMIALPNETPEERLKVAGLRLSYALAILAAFALGSIGAFLTFSWPPQLGQLLLSLLQVAVIVRFTTALGRIFLAPGAERFRLTPMATTAAHFWFVWSAVITGYFFFVEVVLHVLHTNGMARPELHAFGIILGVVLLILAETVLWTYPDRETGLHAKRSNKGSTLFLTVYLALAWSLLFTGSIRLFWLAGIALIIPIVTTNARRTVRNLLRPDGAAIGEMQDAPSLTVVVFERGARAVILTLALLLVAAILRIDLVAVDPDELSSLWIVRAIFDIALIALFGDFIWHLAEAWIDRKVMASEAGPPGAERTHAQAQNRMRTLLPVLKNLLLVVLVIIAGMTILSTLGVAIGPLIASAGIVGVAVGFGSQTLVKDFISGFFFLLDDAFRIGEYIESGNIRGTVEAFSLRSLKIRHHRGALHTVPFGALDKITNYSRDWVIDKIQVGVTYDTDLNLAKKVIKQIGKELAEEPEFAPHILETLKMQGVEQFGDFAIQIRMKMMTKPGEQFAIRRQAYAMIKQRFAETGIQFAFPTVTVAGGATDTPGGDTQAALANRALELIAPKVAPAHDSAADRG